MRKLDYSGVFVVMLTPFDASGRVDLNAVARLVDFYCDAGVDGLFPCGSAGEALHLQLDQKEGADPARGRMRRRAGPGRAGCHCGQCARRAQPSPHIARDAGCDGIVAPAAGILSFRSGLADSVFPGADRRGWPACRVVQHSGLFAALDAGHVRLARSEHSGRWAEGLERLDGRFSSFPRSRAGDRAADRGHVRSRRDAVCQSCRRAGPAP